MNPAMSYPSGAAAFSPNGPSPTKPLWAVIGVLSMCVLAMGASLVSIHKRSAEPTAVPSANFLRFTGSNGAIGLTAPSSGGSKVITETADGKAIENSLPTEETNARPAAKKVAKPVPSKAPTRSTAPNAAAPSNATAAPGNASTTTSDSAPVATQPVAA
jgi:hypothetical protein